MRQAAADVAKGEEQLRDEVGREPTETELLERLGRPIMPRRLKDE